MVEITAFSERNIATRERLEDYAVDAVVTTSGGLNLQLAIVCDGAGGGEVGERAARLTARTILGYLEISPETSIPKLLVKAVEEANRVVFGELQGRGTSTVALAAIDLDDGEFGRLYLASVGDSYILLLRDGQLVRLNIDHTLANEYVHSGQMSRKEADSLDTAEYVTRIIGVGPDVNVDIGFYAEKGKDFVPSVRAFHIGQHGMLLEAGDTILVASDGMFEINPDDGNPYLHDDELLLHALDNNVERATRALMGYSELRNPQDNISVSMLFVPSRDRKAVRTGGLTRLQRNALLVSLIIVAFIIAVLARQSLNVEATISASEGTQIALQETLIQVDVERSWTPTPSNTPTFTPTFTPTATATIRPTIVAAGQVGNQFFKPDSANPPSPLFELEIISAPESNPEINYLSIEGEQGAQGLRDIDSADVYLQPLTSVEIEHVDDSVGRESLELFLLHEGDIFISSGDFVNQGVQVFFPQDSRIVFETRVACLAAMQITPDPNIEDDTEKVVVSCYTGTSENCTYRFSRGRETPVPIGRRVVLDLENREAVGTPSPILYEDAKRYYDTIVELTGSDQAACLVDYLDDDGDGIPYPTDLCPEDLGLSDTFGCPDTDGDGLPDKLDAESEGVIVDECPEEAGPVDNGGCPLPTNTPIFTDTPDISATPSVTPTRTPTLIPGMCGDNIVHFELGEECDPPDGILCDADCMDIPIVCGNDIVQPGEVCDDGNTVSEDGCSALCESELCGDGVTQGGLGEQCDDANTDNADGCTNQCLRDTDTDEVPDNSDNCPAIANPGQADNDGDNQGDVCDLDDDNDGFADLVDDCPFVAGTSTNPPGTVDGCVDSDGDGWADTEDICPGHDDAVDNENDGIPDGV